MQTSREKIKHLQRLARLELDDDEVNAIAEQLGRIVEWVETLQSADTDGVPPTGLIAHTDREHLREDEVTPGLDRDTVLGQAPDADGPFFRVPRVIDRGDA